MATSLTSKLGLKEDSRAILLAAPDAIAKELTSSGAQFTRSLSGSFAYIHGFFITLEKLDAMLPNLKHHLAEGGALWVSWPKAGKLGTDLSLKKIIESGYRHGLVESKTVGVDPTWSAIKFTWPKKGKVYRNSYGKLPSQSP